MLNYPLCIESQSAEKMNKGTGGLKHSRWVFKYLICGEVLGNKLGHLAALPHRLKHQEPTSLFLRDTARMAVKTCVASLACFSV